MRRKKIAIIGAGNCGSAIAGDMSLAGHMCRVFDFPEYAKNIKPIIEQGGIKVTGIARTGFAKVTATTDISEAVKDVDLIMVATVALAHERIAKEIIPYLSGGQTVVLWPGSGGTLSFRKVWDELRTDRRPFLAEAVTSPYCCRRIRGPGTVNIHRVDGPRMLLAALPASDTGNVMKALIGTYADKVKPAVSILEPALYNPNIIVHPVGALLNMGRIEYAKGEFWMYKEGITESVEKVINSMDKERQALFASLGYKPYTYAQVFMDSFNMSREKFAKDSSKGPINMQYRYVTEDIPMGATLTASLAKKIGVATPTYDALIHIASVVNNTNYYKNGRNLENLDLADLSTEKLQEYFITGKK